MISLARALYHGVFDHADDYSHWALGCLAAQAELASIQWRLLPGNGTLLAVLPATCAAGTELVNASLHIVDAGAEFSHEFIVQKAQSAPVGEAELSRLKEALTLLVGAEQASRRLQEALGKARGDGSETRGFAVVDASGAVETADRAFGDYLACAYGHWDGQRLPFSFNWDKKLAEHGMVYRGLYFRFEPAGEGFRLWTRPDRRGPAVSAREMEVARKLSAGMSFKEIARELNLAASTVSTHVYNLYEKLGIRRRVQLVEWVKGQPQN